MVDILERLQSLQTSLGTVWPQPNLHEEAAEKIIQLREELAAVTERMSKLDFERTAAELERDALREENARLLKENSELLFRAHALLWLLPPETTCGELRKARDEMLAATIREGGMKNEKI